MSKLDTSAEELRKDIHALFGDRQVEVGGYYSLYDGGWIDMTNEVCAVADFIKQRELALLEGLKEPRKDIETIEGVLKQFTPDHWAILDLGQALQSIQKIIEREVIGRNFRKNKNTNGYRRKIGNGDWEAAPETWAIAVNLEHRLQRQALANALYGKGEIR